ncbi:MAG: heme exporter protein CcmB [Deltaproteobacteria bacterium]|nr:heme exporter protein CcmB [Deltaproteobacteria bacterium]
MIFFIRQVTSILKKDLLAELREPDHLLSVALFGFVLFVLFSFALSIEPTLMRKMAPGLFWLAVFFSSVLTLERSFQREVEDGQWEGLLLAGGDVRALYLGKMFSNLAMVLALQIILLPLMGILFDLSLSWSLVGVILLGSLGISTLGTCYAGLTVSLKGGEALLPILLFPMLIPVLLAATETTRFILAHDLFGQQMAWIKLLFLFDILFLLGALLNAENFFDRG